MLCTCLRSAVIASVGGGQIHCILIHKKLHNIATNARVVVVVEKILHEVIFPLF